MPIFVLLYLLTACAVAADVTTAVRATGLAALGGDPVAAFDAARREALRQAVEEGVGTLVSARTQVDNYALIGDQVLTRTEGYVCRYDIVDQGANADGTYRVTVDAVVSLQRLQQRLDALRLVVEEVGKPRLLCLGQETGGAAPGLVALELRKALAEVSPDLLQVTPPGAVSQDAFGSLNAAAAVGRQLGADIVIRGRATVQPASRVPIPFADGASLETVGLRSAVSHVQLEALWTDSGEVLASLEGTGSGAAAAPGAAAAVAVRNGVRRLTDDLVRRMVDDWRERAYSGRVLRLEVHAEPAQLQRFEDEVTVQVSGLERLYPRTQEPGSRLYDVRSRHSGFEVARQLAAHGLSGMDVEVLRVSPNTLALHLVAR